MPPPKKVNREILQRIPSLRLVQEIRAILTSRECAAMDFTLNVLGVNAASYRLVADALMHFEPGTRHDKYTGEDLQKFSVKIQVLSVPPQVTIAGGSLVAIVGEYDPENNLLQFPFASTGGVLEQEGTVVHECTHAALDIGPQSPNNLDNEAAARIAKAAYMILKSKAAGGSYSASSDIDTVFQRAAEVMLAFRGCYVFPEAHRNIMHQVLRTKGYNFGEQEVQKYPGWGHGRTMYMPVTIVRRP